MGAEKYIPGLGTMFNIEPSNLNLESIGQSIGVTKLSQDLSRLSSDFTRIKSGSRNGRLFTDFSKWTLWYGTVAQTTEYNLTGPSSLKLTSDAANMTVAARLRQTSLDLSKTKNMMIRFYVYDRNKLSNIELRMSSTDNMAGYLSWKTTKWKTVPGWNEVMIPLSKLTVSGTESLQNNLTTLQISITGAEVGASVAFDAIYLNKNQKGSVQFHFDDGWLTQYTKAFPIMLSKGFVGSIGVISGSVGTTGYMNLPQLRELHTYGWTIFNHTQTHKDLSTISKAQVEIELSSCRKWLEQNGFPESADLVAYPYGGHNEDVLSVMSHYRLGRSVLEEYEVCPPIQPKVLKVINIYNNTEDIIWQTAIDIAAETGCGVTLLFHKIEDTATDSISFATSKFSSVVNYVQSKIDKLDVLTFEEWAQSI
ncbi:Poly-beta-1,6-N-acetyl-D-glucosamine N-deacetylase precursor [compost metagenome]